MKSIAFFNNKGGVGKTTLLCNLAGYLAHRKKKKILVVDADPQCNATQNLFSDETLKEIYGRNQFTIFTVIKPLAAGKGYSKGYKTQRNKSFLVNVIPGDPKLALTEDLFARDWSSSVGGDVRGMRTNFVFRKFLAKCKSYDYVFFDMGPSLGSINRSILISCDYFVAPLSADIFSVKAIENIGTWMNDWIKKLKVGLENIEDKSELGVDTSEVRLRLLGYVSQLYNAKKEKVITPTTDQGVPRKRRAVKAYDAIMRTVPKYMEKHIVTKLQNSLSGKDYSLGGIPNFHSLLPLSQLSRKPIFDLGGKDGVVGAHFEKVKEYDGVIGEIADKFLQNIEELDGHVA